MKLYPPDSDSAYGTKVREYNTCHNPAGPGGGRFCDGDGGFAGNMSVSDAAGASRRDERGWGPSSGMSSKAMSDQEWLSHKAASMSPESRKASLDALTSKMQATPTFKALSNQGKWPGGYIRVSKDGQTGLVYQSKSTHVMTKGGDKHYDSLEALVSDGWVLGSTKAQGKQSRQRAINAMTKAKAKDIQTRLGRYAVSAKKASNKLLGRIRRQFK